ncbi:C-C motif chemokine 4-like [Sardina pilchardus]|uniref:C-C motif chemokine 4-like n=1 Tax=Sardina pilchardus TaxID=27697 RepID=UPI002E146E9E
MNITAFSVCCLISVCVILPAVSSATTDCCLSVSSKDLTNLKPNRVKEFTIQNEGICSIKITVLITVRNKRICADPDSPLVKDIIKKVTIRNRRRGPGNKKRKGGQKVRKIH